MPGQMFSGAYLMALNSEQEFWGLGENSEMDFWIPEVESKPFSRPKIGEGSGWGKKMDSELFLEKHKVAALMKYKLAIICFWLGG